VEYGHANLSIDGITPDGRSDAMDDLPYRRRIRRTFSPQFKRDFLLVHDYFAELSPQLGDALLRMADIPPRYLPRWRRDMREWHARPPHNDHPSSAVHYPMAGVYQGRHRRPRRHGRPNEAGLAYALRNVMSHLVEKRSD